ncbi:MAG: TonB-dependent receptor [Acidobacteriaceae bacterium]|nr:TonB-dependent receptor [Acidobacteriaceae bacterium]
MRGLLGKLVGIGFVLFALAVGGFAQGGATGAISGTVQDPSGAFVAGAEVRITNQDTGVVVRTTKTDSNGAFTATLLPVGTYSVTVHSGGFAEGTFPNIVVRVTETTRMIAQLRTQAVQEKIEVEAQVQAVETTQATTGQAIEAVTIRELPLATQNFQQLLTLSTGVQSELNASAQLGRGSNKIFVNGQREDNNNYLIEGISATDYNVAQTTNVPLPNPDVIGEFKVQTSLYDASQGRNGGGNVNAILKSGTRTFHGDVYEFFRNDVLNANEFFLNRAGERRPSVKQNIFGGSLGGPVGTEKLGFFFVNYQGTRQRSGESPGTAISNPGFPILPATRDAATLIKDFSSPATAGCAAVPIVIDPVILKLLNFKSNQFGGDANGYLIPSLPGTPGLTVGPAPGCTPSINTAPFFITRPGHYRDDQFTTNWDREFRGGNDKISARFFFSDSESFLPFGAGGLAESLGSTLASSIASTDLDFPFDLPIHARFFSINETHLFSPTLVNDFRFGVVHINNSLDNINPVTAADLGIQRPTNNVTQAIYKFTLNSSGFQLGPAPFADQHQDQNNFNFVDNFSWVHGAHVLSWGGEFARVQLDKLFPQVFNGQLIFANAGGLSDFQEFLQGAPPFSFGGGGVYNHQYRTNDFGFYAQDDWKVRKDLTLNLGFRTEVFGGFHDNLCHIGNADPQLADEGKYPFIYGGCVKGLGVPGLNPTGSNTTYRNDYATGLGPRVGFAWDIFGKHTTSLRGGYGIYYVREDVGSVDQLSFNAPFLPVAFGGGLPGCASTFFSASAPANCIPVGSTSNPNALPSGGVIDPAFVPCLAVFQGFPGNDTTQAPSFSCPNGAAGLTSQGIFVLPVPRHFVTPNTQQWNLTLQRELGRRWVLEVGYVGTHSIHLRETRTPLQAQNVSPSNPLTITAANGTPYKIMYDTIPNGPARSRSLPINGYSGMQAFIDDAYSHYHSLQTTVSRRWGAGYFQAAYTFSRSTDATSSGNTAFATAWNDESSLTPSRGLSDFDRTHRLIASYRYDLPLYRNVRGAKAALLGNWSIGGISIFQSGTPFSVFDSGAGTAFLGAGLAPTLGAELAPGGTIASGKTSGDIHQRLNGYLNINNFTTAPLVYPQVAGGNPAFECNTQTNPNFCGTNFGDLGRNIYRGPFQQNWDFSLIKNFAITERQTLRFTTDFFNLWNHPNFANPAQNDVENPSTFGKIISTAGTPRLIQFSLRYAF